MHIHIEIVFVHERVARQPQNRPWSIRCFLLHHCNRLCKLQGVVVVYHPLFNQPRHCWRCILGGKQKSIAVLYYCKRTRSHYLGTKLDLRSCVLELHFIGLLSTLLYIHVDDVACRHWRCCEGDGPDCEFGTWNRLTVENNGCSRSTKAVGLESYLGSTCCSSTFRLKEAGERIQFLEKEEKSWLERRRKIEKKHFMERECLIELGRLMNELDLHRRHVQSKCLQTQDRKMQ